jgi:hypothetical protein
MRHVPVERVARGGGASGAGRLARGGGVSCTRRQGGGASGAGRLASAAATECSCGHAAMDG